MRWRHVVAMVVLAVAAIGAPAAADEGIHLVEGPADADGCHSLEVWNGEVRVAVIENEHGPLYPYCRWNLLSTFLPNGILLFDWNQATLYAPARDLWASDGTSEGTILLEHFDGGRSGVSWEVIGPVAFISRSAAGEDNRIVATRGTAETTLDLPGGDPGTGGHPGSPLYVRLGDRILFSAIHPAKGRELWVSDGTLVGTHLVKDIRRGAKGSRIRYLRAADGLVRFSADDGSGRAPWVTDGTREGTHKWSPPVAP